MLSKRFIAPNLVMDLAEFFWRVKGAEANPVVAPITYGDVRRALAARADGNQFPHANPNPFDPLVGTHAAVAVKQLFGTDNPWRAINLSLAFEAIHRVFANNGKSAFGWASKVFDDILRAAPDIPAGFDVRGPRVKNAFEAWWKACADVLTETLRNRRTQILKATSREDLGRFFVKELESSDAAQQTSHMEKLFRLTLQKNNRLTGWIGQANVGPVSLGEERTNPRPDTPPGWLEGAPGRIVSRALASRDFKEEFCFTKEDLDFLCDGLLPWVEDNGFASLIGPTGLAKSEVRKACSGETRCLGGSRLDALLAEFQDLSNLLRMRGLPPVVNRPAQARMQNLPPQWAKSLPVSDLFAYPIWDGLQGWNARAGLYGIPDCPD